MHCCYWPAAIKQPAAPPAALAEKPSERQTVLARTVTTGNSAGDTN